MPMPHRTQMQLIKRRLVGKDGSERVRELRTILAELPGYKNGPYADIRKWVESQLEHTRVQKRVTHRDSIAVRREGAAQIALVGPPNAGKSSLLQALSNIQIKTGAYAFTTTRPVPALTRVGGVLVQLVEIPGLIEGASAGRGGARPLLGVLRGADAILFCHDASAPVDELRAVMSEVSEAGIERPSVLAATKSDEADGPRCERAFPELPGRRGQRARRCERRAAARDDLAADGSHARLSTRRRASDRAATRRPRWSTSRTPSITSSERVARVHGSGDRRRASTASRSAADTSCRTVTAWRYSTSYGQRGRRCSTRSASRHSSRGGSNTSSTTAPSGPTCTSCGNVARNRPGTTRA